MFNKDHYHFIGLGGIGMSGIALALLKKGFSVSGSDITKNDRLIEISKNGGIVFNTQHPKNITLMVIDPNTGEKAKFTSKNTIIESYKSKNVLDGKVLYSDNNRLDTNNILKFY